MNLLEFTRNYAEEIDGQFTDYDHSKSVIVVPLSGDRFQTVLCISQKSPVSGKEQIAITSKVCMFTSNIDLKHLLEQNANFDYSKFIIEDGYVKVDASGLAASMTEEQLKEMIQEVAQLADHYEFKFTGKDIH